MLNRPTASQEAKLAVYNLLLRAGIDVLSLRLGVLIFLGGSL